MRTITSNAALVLAAKTGIESIVVVKIQWNQNGGNFIGYADEDIEGIAEGRIVELSGLESVTRADGDGSSMSVNVTLSDFDGAIKNIFDNIDIHKAPVQFWQSFKGFDASDMFLIGSGIIHSPITWNEGGRTLSINVTSRLESWETGFSAEEGHFPTLSQKLIGQPWPMVFGTVTHSPALKLQEIPTFFTVTPFGVADPSLGTQISKVAQHIAGLKQQAQSDLIYAALACFEAEAMSPGGSLAELDAGIRSGTSLCNDDPTVQGFNQAAQSAQEEANSEQQNLISLGSTYAQQIVWQVPTEIIANVYITQPYTGVFKVGNQLFYGKTSSLDSSGTVQRGSITPYPPVIFDEFPGQVTDGNGNPVPGAFGPTTSAFPIQKQGFQFYNAGTQVTIAGPYPLSYMVSMIPGTVNAVYAFRSFNGLRHLTVVPQSYYTIENVSYGNVDTVQVKLIAPLSTIAWHQNEAISNWENAFGQYLPSHIVNQIDWEDDLYVSFTSSVGPNPVDIIKYIITRWCVGMSYDATSFSTAHGQVDHFLMNFMLAARPNAIDFINELAYQCNCAVWIDNDTFFIKYLPVQATPVDTLMEDDIVVNTLRITTSDSESLVTKYEATYRPDYSPVYEDPVRLILRFNINKYGVHHETHDFYAYNNYWEVEKAAQFWFIRKSQTWKYLEVQAVMTKLALETWDTVTLNFSHPFVANGPVVGIVESAVYDSANNVANLRIWVPVRVGEMTQFEFAFPASATEDTFWPVYRDLQAGNGGSLSQANGHLPPGNPVSYQIRLPGTVRNPQEAAYALAPGDDPDDTLFLFEDPFSIQVANIARGTLGNPQPQLPVSTRNETKLNDTTTPTTPPTFRYNYEQLTDPQTIIGAPPSHVYPCQITDFKGFDDKGNQLYAGIMYRRGLKNEGSPFEGVQLQLDPNDRIPSGTWTHVHVAVWSEDKNDDGTSTSSSGAKGPDGQPLQPKAGGTGVSAKNWFSQKTIQLPVWLQ